MTIIQTSQPSGRHIGQLLDRSASVARKFSTPEVRSAIYRTIDASNDELRELNKYIHDNPELGYEEYLACAAITTTLENHGFTVKQGAYGYETSFEAECGSGGRLVVFCAEYDALPNIGHACGHNLIATSSVAAFLGLAKTILKMGLPGRIRIIGTPAEEGGGGKVKLLEAGAFTDDIAAAIMAHPMAEHTYKEGYTGLAGTMTLASHKLKVEFRGKSAHASAEPFNGLNALDAAVAAYTNISMLRQQIRPDERIHGVIEDGGTVPNVITEYTRMNYNIRSPTIKRADELLARVKLCFEAAAMATGCTLNYIYAPTYSDLKVNDTLSKQYVEDMEDLGEKISLRDSIPGSTDMGNVSYAVPSFHGTFAIPAPENASNHQPLFAEAAGTDDAHSAAVRCAKGMAMLGWRVLTDARLAAAVRRDFDERGHTRGSSRSPTSLHSIFEALDKFKLELVDEDDSCC